MKVSSKKFENVDLEKNCISMIFDGKGISDEIIVGKSENKLLCVDYNLGCIFEIKSINSVLKDFDFEVNGYEIINKNIKDYVDFNDFDLEY